MWVEHPLHPTPTVDPRPPSLKGFDCHQLIPLGTASAFSSQTRDFGNKEVELKEAEDRAEFAFTLDYNEKHLHLTESWLLAAGTELEAVV